MNEINDKLQLTVGGYKEITRASGGGGFGSYTPGISTPYGSTPGYYTPAPASASYQSTSWGKSTYFRTILDKSNHEHLPQYTSNVSVFDKIKKYEDGLEGSARISTVFKMDSNYYFTYYYKKSKTLRFVEFTPQLR
ncbi:MAG: hypothetical protein AAF693_20420 [Bacteroidota bacterium]